jgi:hypothetical protein
VGVWSLLEQSVSTGSHVHSESRSAGGPQFAVGRDWCGVEEIHGPLEPRADEAVPFANDGETLFEAVRSTVIDFDGRTRACSTACDLSRFVVAHGGIFDSRDDLFNQLGSFEDTWKGRAFELLYAGRRSSERAPAREMFVARAPIWG